MKKIFSKEINNDEKVMDVKERLAILEKMHETDELMQIMFDAAPFGTHFWNSDLQIVDCNEATVKLFKVSSKQEFLEKFYLFSPEYQPDGRLSSVAAPQFIKDTFEKGYMRIDWTHQLLNGELIPCEMTLVRVDYKDNQFVAAYVRDVREQKAALEIAQAAVRASEETKTTASAMFESSPHINVLFNSSFQVIDCNPAAIQFMGFSSKEEMVNGFVDRLTRSIPEFQPGGRISVPIAERLITTVKQGSVKFETELILNGVTRNFDIQFKRIPYEGSFAISAFVFDMTDIHEREMELKHSQDLNELQLAKLDLAVKATKIGLWDMAILKDDPLNPENPIIWSESFRQMLGFNNEIDFPNLVGSFLDSLHPEDLEKVSDAFLAHIMDLTGNTPYDIECRLSKKNGEYGYFHASGETVRDKDGNPIHVAGALMDITETKIIYLDTVRQRIEAEAANQAKTAFLSTMSHEIRTPLNAILGITEIELQNESLDNKVKDSFEKIYTSGDLLLGIINDILDLSKIEAGKLELTVAKYEIASMISDTVQLNMMRIGSKPIEFELNIDESLPTVLSGDELRVKQILNNILSNAIKYTDEGKVCMSVTAELIESNADAVNLVFTINDTGQGMSEEQVNKLFDAYARFNTETNRTTEGTGLGMSITQNLIRLMSGEIFVKSEPGKGTTFTIQIPQYKVGSDVLGKEMAENLKQFRVSSRTQMKRVQITRDPMPYGSVLIVDDVETNIFVAKGLLAPYRLKVDSVDNGYSAVDKIKEGNVYDIVFMDHMMPKMDGIETTKLIRKNGYTEPIVALTANAVAGQADIFLGNGFNDFISKPIDIRQLNTILNKFIRDKQPPEVVEAARKQAAPEEIHIAENKSVSNVDPRFAKIFARDAVKAMAILEEISEKNDYDDVDNLRSYIINVHGMKSALANIGEVELSKSAQNLEAAAREGKLDIVSLETPYFINYLRAFTEEIAPPDDNAAGENIDEDKEYLKEKLNMIKDACEVYDENTADDALSELKNKSWSRETKKLLEAIADKLLHSDFDEIAEDIKQFYG